MEENRARCEDEWSRLVNDLRGRMQSDVDAFFDAIDRSDNRLKNVERYVW